MLISPAYAQAAGDGGSGLISMLPLVLIFVVFYFLLIRPQQKKMKAHRSMVDALKRGDRVVTGGGLVGTVTKSLGDNELQVEIADGVRVKVMRHTIQEVVARSGPADKGSDAKKKAANDEGESAKAAQRGWGGFDLSNILGLGSGKKSGS
jgi:preprotein translocase subunit YajC